ncbi:MAG: hypothetical protein K6348_00750, partial [Deferribacterales bacterium]
FGATSGITTSTTQETGIFDISFMIDTQPYGTYNITSISGTTHVSATDKFKVLPQIIKVTPTQVYVGDEVIVEGSGYVEVGTIKLDFGKTEEITSIYIESKAKGLFEAKFIVDTQPQGTTIITAYASEASALIIRDTDKVVIKGEIISVRPTEGYVGDKITIKGAGYSSQQEVKVGFGKTEEITTITSTYAGTFTCVFRIDTQPAGTTVITADDTYTKDTDSLIIKGRIISVSPTQAYVGGEVTVIGAGYNYKATVDISFGKTEKITQVESTGFGTYLAKFIIDTQPAGTTTIRAKDTSQEDTDELRIIGQIIKVTPTEATVGELITVEGVGFDAKDSVQIGFGKAQDLT